MDLAVVDFVVKLAESTILGALLVAIVIGLWKAGRWIGTEILTPLKTRIVSHIDRLDEATSRMEKTVEKIEVSVSSQNAAIEKQSEVLEIAAQSNQNQTEKIERIDKNVRGLREGAGRFFGQQNREYEDRHRGE